MKSILKSFPFIHLLCSGICSNNFIAEEVTDSELLSFSFNKASFNVFKCIVGNTSLSHSSLHKPPFYESESVRNFLSTLCLFFQYGELKNNKKFKRNIRSLFVIYSKKMHYIKGDLAEYTYDPQSFKDRMLKLDETIKNILEEQDPIKQIVSVEEQGDRIIITQKIVSRNLHFKIVETGIKEFSKEYLEDEALVAWYELLNKMYEMHLEGLLGNNFKKGTELISEKFRELSQSEENSATQKRSTASETEVYNLYSRFNQALNSSDSTSKAFNCQPSDHELSDEEKIELKNQARDLAFKKIVSGDVPEYFYELVFKVRSKIIWNISKGLTDDYDLYSEYSIKDIKIMCELKRMLKEYLQKSTKIFFYHKLSVESISNLVRICLEFIL